MSKGRILIVEDDKDLRDVYSLVLEMSGHQVSSAHNGQDALQKVKAFNPNLILLDIYMPVLDGKGFLQNIDLGDYPNTTVIVCSNTADKELMQEMIDLGAKKVVTKSSLAPNDLIALVDPFLV